MLNLKPLLLILLFALTAFANIPKQMLDTTPPLAIIDSPLPNTTVKTQLDIIGTASDRHLVGYRLLISPLGKI